MNPNQLQALLIDRHFGELPQEVAALLDAYLEICPEAGAEAGKVRDVLAVTRATVARHPDLLPASDLPGALPVEPPRTGQRRFGGPALRLAAAVTLLGALIAGSYYAGWSRSEAVRLSPPPIAAGEPVMEPGEPESPWARYRVGADGRLAVVVASAAADPKPPTRSQP